MVNIFLDADQKETSEDICSICHDTFNDNYYEIPECKHKFHTPCIIEWYRTGNIRCPYCNSTPSVMGENNYYHSRKYTLGKYKIITNYCKRKDANPKIIKKVESIRKLNDKVKEYNKLIKNIKDESGTYAELSKKIKALKRSRWSIERNILNKKKELVDSVNIIPYMLNKN